MKLGLVVGLGLALVGCLPAQSAAPADMRTAAERAEDRSVALLDDDGDATCSGVWVGVDRILTAYHCVKSAGRPASLESLELFGDLFEFSEKFKPWDPIGQFVSYTDRQGSAASPVQRYEAKIAAYDKGDDLALLQATSVYPMHHDVAPVSTSNIHDGDEVDVIGSTSGLAFSYSHGYVGATREVDHNDAERKFKALQITAPVWFGNSGGGAFDAHGALIGIVDYMIDSSHGMVPLGFCVHRDALAAFLHEHRA